MYIFYLVAFGVWLCIRPSGLLFDRICRYCREDLSGACDHDSGIHNIDPTTARLKSATFK